MHKSFPILILAPLLCFSGCGGGKSSDTESPATPEKAAAIDPMDDKGIGPVSSVTLGPIDDTMAAAGKAIFDLKCSACHKVEKRFIGPSPRGVLERRTPEWIMNMILDPDGMVKNNAAARQLLMEYSAPMANQNLTEEDARAVLEYFRTLN